MRAHDFIIEDNTTFRDIPLRQLNKEKHDYKRRKASFERRQRLIPRMYANPGKELEQIELEKARLELAQQRAELAATHAEMKNEDSAAIGALAKSARQNSTKSAEKITSMARSQMRRKKK